MRGNAPQKPRRELPNYGDGKSLSYRDMMETVLEAGTFLKERHPLSVIIVVI
jgi:hypothetical protein